MANILFDGTITSVGPISIVLPDSGFATIRVAAPDGQLVETCFIPASALRGVLRRAAVMPRIRAAAGAGKPWSMERIYQLLLGHDKESEQSVEGIDLDAIKALRNSDPALALFGSGLGLKSALEVAHGLPRMPVAPIELHGVRKDLDEEPELLDLMQEAEVEQFAGRASAASRRAKLDTQKTTLERAMRKATDAERAKLKEKIAELDELITAESAKMGGMVNTTKMLTSYSAMPPGVVCSHSLRILDDAPEKSGQIIAGLGTLSLSPVIGGQRARGAGQIACEYTVKRIADGRAEPLGSVKVGGFEPLAFMPANDAGRAWFNEASSAWDAMVAKES
jgi:hypothetical protein